MNNPHLGPQKAILILGCVIIAVLIFTTAITPAQFPQTENPESSISLPTGQISSPEADESDVTPSEKEDVTLRAINNAVTAWNVGEISYENAVKELGRLQRSTFPELSALAGEQLDFIMTEERCNRLVVVAEKQLTDGQYLETFKSLNSIDTKYTNYKSVEDLYSKCQGVVLESVSNPASIEEFERYINLINNCLTVYNSEEFSSRQEQLTKELDIFVDVTETIQNATNLYDSGQYQEAFVTLALGIDKYPSDQRLATSLVDYRDHYIISITKEATALCEAKKYKDAQNTVECAIKEYDCDEFQFLLESIKGQRGVLYQFKDNLIEQFKTLTYGVKSEEFDVKKAATSAGTYIVKSGEKLFLGDYSEEKVTVLSFGGNIATSLANADILFDIRDLTYDIVHWGEGDYFAVYLAADVIALLPIIGVVKYFDHFKSVSKGADLVDSVADVSKSTSNVVEVADAVKDTSKVGDSISDAIDSAKNVARVGEAAKDAVVDIVGDYKLVKTINQNLLGSKHPETGVEFVLSKLKYSNGEMIEGVFPKFNSFADIDLPKELYKATFKEQQDYCIKRLKAEVRPIIGKYREQFTPDQLADIKDGILPEGFTWHHNEKEGLMQLVDTVIHNKTAHTGGMSLWGTGY